MGLSTYSTATPAGWTQAPRTVGAGKFLRIAIGAEVITVT